MSDKKLAAVAAVADAPRWSMMGYNCEVAFVDGYLMFRIKADDVAVNNAPMCAGKEGAPSKNAKLGGSGSYLPVFVPGLAVQPKFQLNVIFRPLAKQLAA